MCEMVNKLKHITDPNNPYDQKILLLAEMVSNKFEVICNVQKQQNENIKETNTLINNLANSVKMAIAHTDSCPVYKEKEKYETVTFFLKKPKIAVLSVFGLVVLALLQMKDFIIDFIQYFQTK